MSSPSTSISNIGEGPLCGNYYRKVTDATTLRHRLDPQKGN